MTNGPAGTAASRPAQRVGSGEFGAAGLGEAQEGDEGDHVADDSVDQGSPDACAACCEAHCCGEERARGAADVVGEALAGAADGVGVELGKERAESGEDGGGAEAQREAEEEQNVVGALRDVDVGQQQAGD